MKNWTQERREELEKLEELLYQIRGLNNGSHFINKIEKCISLSQELTTANLSENKRSFLNFLNQEAIKEDDNDRLRR